jgi:galactose mutarotase-like enzyme
LITQVDGMLNVTVELDGIKKSVSVPINIGFHPAFGLDRSAAS